MLAYWMASSGCKTKAKGGAAAGSVFLASDGVRRFAYPTGGHWLAVDLAIVVEIVEVVIKVRPDTYREDVRNLFVESSNDNITWMTEWTVPSIPALTAGETRTFTKP